MKQAEQNKLKKCKGRKDFCWPWYEKFTNGKLYSRPKGLGILTSMNMETKKEKGLAVIVYGKKKGDTVLVNYCPFCGADYKKMGRL